MKNWTVQRSRMVTPGKSDGQFYAAEYAEQATTFVN